MKRDGCETPGAVELVDKRGETWWLPTICKTWKCRGCVPKLLALVMARTVYGMECLGPCLFITVTYRMKRSSDLKNAGSVGADLKKLWRILGQRKRWQDKAYFKVPELTKQGQVHVHMIVGGVNPNLMNGQSGKPSCRKRNEKYLSWVERKCYGGCLQHEVSEVWRAVTGDSFVVDVSQVRSRRHTASYVTNYIKKGFTKRGELEARGFKRRYAFSENWPSMGRMQLVGTLDKEWTRVTRVPAHYLHSAYPEVHDYIREGGDTATLPRAGENVVEHVFGKAETNKIKRALKKVKVNDDNATV